jgi:hypothetical protein
VGNDGGEVMWWPEKPRDPNAAGYIPIGDRYEARLTNYSDKALLAVEVTFKVSFLEALPAKAVSKRNSDGTSQLSVTADYNVDPEAEVFAQDWPVGQILSAQSGRIVGGHIHIATIPVIPPRNNVTLHLVSQTKWFTRFTLPANATAVIDGDPGRRVALLVRPAMSPIDKVARWGLPPSIYPWAGVSDSRLEPVAPFVNPE